MTIGARAKNQHVGSLTSGAGRGQQPAAGTDRLYGYSLAVMKYAVAAILFLFVFSIVTKSIPGWQKVGFHFFTGTDWNYGGQTYGAFPIILGTLVTAGVAISLAAPIGIGTALAITFLIPRRIRTTAASIIELLAVVPSVIYGVWGLLVLNQWLGEHGEPWLKKLTHGGWPFSGPGIGVGVLLGSLVLSVMILPTVISVSRDVFAAVPTELIEAGLSLGATKSQVLRKVVLANSRGGVVGAVTLALGRALGETIALVLLLGGVTSVSPEPTNLLATGATLASEIANNFGNLTDAVSIGILCCCAVTLMLLTGSVNVLARRIVRRSQERFA